MDFFEKIVQWNEERNLLVKEFDYKNEMSFIVEEILESTGQYDSISSRDKAKEIVQDMLSSEGSKEQIVDSLADIIVYSTGAIRKLGYNPSKVMDEVFKEIDSRKGTIIDGKFVKDPNIKPYTANFDACVGE